MHVWFPVNHAVAFADTKAFHITRGGNRFSGCYIDGGRAVFEPAALTRNIWTKGFECCQRGDPAPGTPSSGIILVGTKVGPGLSIINNEFGGGSIFHLPAMWPGGGGGPDRAPTAAAIGDGRDAADPPVKACARTDPVGRYLPNFLNTSSSGKDCQGLKPQESASTPAACAAACCADEACSVYQFCGAGETCDGASSEGPSCYTGVWDCTGERKGWQGMGHPGAAPGPGPTPGGPLTVKGVRITHNSMTKAGVGTQATLSLTQTGATAWLFDFCPLLVFAQIAYTKVHVSAEVGFPLAVARPTKNCTVLVETSTPVTGTITVEVDSSAPYAGM